MMFTAGILQEADPARWRDHLFGLSRERWQRLSGKSIWITGAGTGYGRALAVALAAAGTRIFISGRRREKLLDTLDEMKQFGIQADCHIVEFDMTQPGEITAACERVARLSECLYGLINNAALPSSANRYPLQEDTFECWERMQRTNVTSHWLVTREIFSHMKRGCTVRILFVTSEAGWAFTPGFGPYNITKAALNSLAASTAAEYADRYPNLDVQINALIPGEARTEMNRSSTESPYSATCMALTLLSHPEGGPNGKFFHRDGRHFNFNYAEPYGVPLT
jgi:gluconate 5-dehydrogenase